MAAPVATHTSAPETTNATNLNHEAYVTQQSPQSGRYLELRADVILNFHTNVLQDINTFEKIAHLARTGGKGRDREGMHV